MISDTASQTSSVATEPAELSDVDLQLRAVDIAAFQAAPHLLAQAASSKIGLSYPNDEASLDLLVGTLVRLRSPWRDPRIPMYSAARLDVLRAGSIEVDLLHERTRTVLQAAQRTVSLADISDTPLTDRERREAGLPSADASSRLASAEHLFSRRRETIRAAMSTQGYVDQLKAMRAPAGYVAALECSRSFLTAPPAHSLMTRSRSLRGRRHTEIERRWHELRGGIFEHELCDDSPEDRCPPGHLSLNALIAQTLGADQLAASTGFVRELTPHNRCGSDPTRPDPTHSHARAREELRDVLLRATERHAMRTSRQACSGGEAGQPDQQASPRDRRRAGARAGARDLEDDARRRGRLRRIRHDAAARHACRQPGQVRYATRYARTTRLHVTVAPPGHAVSHAAGTRRRRATSPT
tara:strand:+ start:599 stop:1834 length:1236 start_codon:yes stop_codon:yes gene_type:complete